MLYIIDLDSYLTVAKFSDDQWSEAQAKLTQLKRRNPGQRFALRDH